MCRHSLVRGENTLSTIRLFMPMKANLSTVKKPPHPSYLNDRNRRHLCLHVYTFIWTSISWFEFPPPVILLGSFIL